MSEDTLNLGPRPPMSAEQAISMPSAEALGKKARAPRTPAAAPAGAPRSARNAPRNGLSGRRIDITLHDSQVIPPTGQFFGINGNSFLLKPGIRANVPVELVEVLDNCIQTEAILDDKLRVIGHRNVPRLTYQLHRDQTL